MNAAAVAVIYRNDKYLCVWNKRYGGWSFPGGKVEEGESVGQALARELYEETGLILIEADEIYKAETSKSVGTDRGRVVHVCYVKAYTGVPKEVEPGCPVTWLTREEFLKWSPFADFYKKMWETL